MGRPFENRDMAMGNEPTERITGQTRVAEDERSTPDAGQQLVAMPVVDLDDPPAPGETRPVAQVVEERAERKRRADVPERETVDQRPQSGSSEDTVPPRPADGIDLVGAYKDSGYKTPRYIARRDDGQIIQLSELLYLVAESCDGKADYAEIAERVTEKFHKTVSADNVRQLVDEQLRPLGVLTAPDGSSPEVQKADPLLALKFRTKVIPAGFVRALTTIFRPLYWPPVVLAILGALVALDAWLFFVHGVAQPTREVIYQPALLLMVVGLTVVSVFFHEIGHATALRYGGGNPGVMGAGIYVVWPAFYTDVTDAYRLSKGGRIRTDLGGVYFNGIFALLTAGAYFLTGFEPLLLIVLLQHFAVLQQMLPLLRLDGYYVLSDWTGVPDLFARIRPTLRSMLPWRKTEDSVKELKPWVRVVVTGWVLVIIPVLLYIFTMMIVSAPRIFSTAWDSFFIQLDRVRVAFDDGQTSRGVASSFQMVALTLPLAGMSFTFTRMGQRLATGAWKTSSGRPILRTLYLIVGAGALAGLAYLWLPNGEYRPIQPEERGTIGELAGAVREIPGGRPGLTPDRAEDLDGAPNLRDTHDPRSGDPFDSPTRNDRAVVDGNEQEEPAPDAEATPAEEEPEESPSPEEEETTTEEEVTPTPEATEG